MIEQKSKLFIFAGINGAGKTTLYYNHLENGVDLGRRINIDEIVTAIGDWKNEKDQIRASKIALKQRKICLDTNQTFNQETTLSGKGIVKLMQKAKMKGYIIYLYYVGLKDTELAKDRVAQRMLKGGHFVDNKTIDRRYPKSLDNLSKVLPIVDYAYIYDNTINFNLIAKKQDSKIEVLNQVNWFNN